MKNQKYIFMVLLGGTLYGTMSSFVKLSYSQGFTAAEISFWQAFIAAVLLWACTLVGRRRKSMAPSQSGKSWQLLLTGCAIGLTNFLYYDSVEYIPASLAIILLMQYTWMSLLLEWALFRRRPSRQEGVTVLVIMAGTLLAGKVLEGEEFEFSIVGIVLALASSLTYALYIIANGRVGTEMCWQRKSALIMTGSSLCIFAVNGTKVLPAAGSGSHFLLWALWLAIAGTTIPTALFAEGISRVGAALSSILMTVELPVAVLCAHAILHEPVSPMQCMGVVIMLGAICSMNYLQVKPIRK
ncbi:MAG: EamA family transporter [Prevotella sp.]|jgi:drug/metabolite transporter (DMT)-like permease